LNEKSFQQIQRKNQTIKSPRTKLGCEILLCEKPLKVDECFYYFSKKNMHFLDSNHFFYKHTKDSGQHQLEKTRGKIEEDKPV
jgi:hypothetical protein